MNSNHSPLTRFLFRLAAFVSLQMVVAAVVVSYGSPEDSNHYLSALQDKLQRVDDCPGDRLMVLGGSNVAFGIHSTQLQETTGMETINVGLHMSLGLHYPLECVRQHGRPGDVVVLIPEYQLLVSDVQDGDPKVINQLLEQWPSATRYFDQTRYNSWKQFLDRDALWTSHEWLKRAYYAIRKRKNATDIYRRSSFNQYGDVIAHHGRTADSISQTGRLPEVDPGRLDQAVELLNAFAQECRDRDIDVYLSYSPLPEETFALSEDVVQRVHDELKSRLDMPILNCPEDYVFPMDHFFDTAFHLSEVGGAKRTRAVGEALSRWQDSQTRIAEGRETTEKL